MCFGKKNKKPSNWLFSLTADVLEPVRERQKINGKRKGEKILLFPQLLEKKNLIFSHEPKR